MDVRRESDSSENPRRDRQNLIGLFQIMFRAQQSHIRSSETASALRERNVMIEMQILR